MLQTDAPGFEVELHQLLEAINLKYDFDFRQYTSPSLKRTIVQAMNRMGFATLALLGEKILADVVAFDDLIQSLTVPVSEMFRDSGYFLALREKVIPILRTYPSLKIWVAGCSTGEEVFSLAILLQEEGLLERTIIYATDINSRSLEKAKTGLFDVKELQKYTHGYNASGGKRSLTDYYTLEGNSARFDPALIRNVSFTDHSLVTDAVFSETHLISCRNVLIYFNRALQDQVYELFFESLCRKCFLGLGSKETVQFSKWGKHFASFAKKDRIFQKL
ncbi:MAG: CheR family methyltransferase [Bdellovibrionales bacterium]